MKVVTFGSCLSRLISVQMNRHFNAEITSSCYHNRSDAFIGRFVEKDWVDYPMDLMANSFGRGKRRAANVDENVDIILQNQYIPHMGSHRLPTFVPFFDALKLPPDVIIVDNHIDLGGRLLARRQDPKAGIFSLLKADPNSDWEIRPKIAVEDAVVTMGKVIDFFRQEAPTATIIFVNFPHNTYIDNPDRVARTKAYEALFRYDGIKIIPCLEVPQDQWSPDPQHFRSGMYTTFAHIIGDHLKAVGKGHLLEAPPQRTAASPKASQGRPVDPHQETISALFRDREFDKIAAMAGDLDDDALSPRTLYLVAHAFYRTRDKVKAYKIFDKAADSDKPHKPSLEMAIKLAADLQLHRDLENLLARHQAAYRDDSTFRSKYGLVPAS